LEGGTTYPLGTLRALRRHFGNVTQLIEIARHQPRCKATKRTYFSRYWPLNGPPGTIYTILQRPLLTRLLGDRPARSFAGL
jgi:hypothetical protein